MVNATAIAGKGFDLDIEQKEPNSGNAAHHRLTYHRFSRRLDSVLKSWSANGRQIARPLKVTFFAFLAVTGVVLTTQNVVNEFRNLKKPIESTSASAAMLFLHQKSVASSGLEQALLGLSTNETFRRAVASRDMEALRNEADAVFDEMASFHHVSEFSVYGPDMSPMHKAHLDDSQPPFGRSLLLKTAHRENTVVRGLEFGDNGLLSLTAVRPWMNGDTVIGYLKIAMALEEPLAFIGATLDAQAVKVYRRDQAIAGSGPALGTGGWAHAGPYAYKSTTSEPLPAAFGQSLAAGLSARGLTDRLFIADRRVNVVHVLPVTHSDGFPTTAIVLLQDVTDEFVAFLKSTGVSLLIGLAFASLFWTIFNRLIRNLQHSVLATREKLENEVETNTRKLELSKNRLLEAQKIASVGSWERDLLTGDLHWTEEMFHIVGVPIDTCSVIARKMLYRQIPVSERTMVESVMEQAIRTCSEFDFEHQIIRSDGAVRHLHVRGYATPDEHGEARKIFGTTHDITDRQVARQQSQLLAGIMEASLNEVYLFDAHTFIFEYANACGCDNLGYTIDEITSLAPWDVSPQHSEQSFRTMVAPLLNGSVSALDVEGIQLRKDGSQYPVEVRLQLYKERNTRLFVAIANDLTERTEREKETRAAKEKAERMAYFDPLTQLANRACCQKDAERLFAPGAEDTPAFIIHMDLDNFKRINDTLGHPAGDHCLEEAGERLKTCCSGLGTAYRWGGDEFVIIADGPYADPEELCERANIVMRAPMEFEGSQIWPSVSMGIARCPQDGTDFGTLLVNADLALYRSKENGKDRWSYFTHDMKIDSDQEARTESELREAIHRDEFFLVFQPQVNIRTQMVTGVEALVRWQHPTRGVLGPGAFLPVVEKTNLASTLGEIVIDKALAAARAWLDKGYAFGRIAVNLSPSHLISGTLLADFNAAMKRHQVEPHHITAEVLESVFLDDERSDNSQVLEELHRLGVHIELDDFGTGYASLSHVADLPINGLKIDRSFTARILTDVKKEIVVNQLIHLARSLDIGVICEGVETEAQFGRLRMMGDFSVQGYLIARPMPYNAMTDWLSSSPADLRIVV